MGYLDNKGLAYLWEKVKARSIPVKPVTQAQYDALPEEQKGADVMYLVTDGISSIQLGFGLVPSGGIIAWHGTVDSIPDGWALCDGTNGTPDLRDQFVLGAGGKYSVGAAGGEETHKLTTAEMPAHNHKSTNTTYSSTLAYRIVGTDPNGTNKNTVTSISAQNSQPNTTDTGSGNAHNNMPPYYALYYIKKL